MDAEDRLDILNVMALYGHVIDARAWDRVHEVVTEDAEFDSSALGPGGGGSRAGLENVVAFWRTAPHPPAHHFANAYIYEEDGEVRSLSKWVIADGHGGIFGGDYHDVWRKTDAGWRIRKRVITGRHGLDTFFERLATSEDSGA
jgi:hypothetical protein